QEEPVVRRRDGRADVLARRHPADGRLLRQARGAAVARLDQRAGLHLACGDRRRAVAARRLLLSARRQGDVLRRTDRPASGRRHEFPAGKLEAGDPVLSCAVRELFEESGYRAAEWARAGITHNAIAYATEGIEIWFARGLVAGERRLDHGEFLDVLEATSDEL